LNNESKSVIERKDFQALFDALSALDRSSGGRQLLSYQKQKEDVVRFYSRAVYVEETSLSAR